MTILFKRGFKRSPFISARIARKMTRHYAAAQLCVGVLISLIAAASADTFYFSTVGSDQNSGTSPDQPWLSLNKTRAVAPLSGSTFLLKRGDVWFDQPLELFFAANVTVGAYGDPTAPRPRISHSRPASAAARQACLRAVGVSNLSITNLYLQGCFKAISLVATAGKTLQNIDIADNFFSDIYYPMHSYSPSNPQWGTAVSVDGAAVVNLSVRNNIASRLDAFFNNGGNVAGLYLDSNTVAHCNGNCVGFGSGSDLHLRQSVFARDQPHDLFLYGTTDVIIGTIEGANSVENTDFNQRGEYMGGPDGCAFDFETAATGFRLSGCTFYQSYGAGIMVFGHATTSQNVSIDDNNFIMAGCEQPHDDHGGIAFICPNNQKPSAVVANNRFWTCGNGSVAMYDRIPGCSSNVDKVNNTIDQGEVVAMPVINLDPVDPTDPSDNVTMTVVASCTTPGATLRYTIDGSRPEADAPVLPSTGLPTTWPGPTLAVNIRAFKDNAAPSVTNTIILERANYAARSSPTNGLDGAVDHFVLTSTQATLSGWVVDNDLPGHGLGPATVAILVDGELCATQVANQERDDLVPAGVAPNPYHGFNVTLPDATLQLLLNSPQSIVEVRVQVDQQLVPCPGYSIRCVAKGAVDTCP
ncbi:uncharacterized protein MONBRDRAFT_12805 [Monosiga brevicollis MX1]|uniref:GH29D-like beta-sandwich domain-containing protein n=1 Tax=Monosiga brevicollis TaxID=81824 RepID=A9VDD5_MONBE|nr:uncharacterized protein MONBRDRAFT_12805 [Monosiga brevicollis MX1]EDQ84453.1 predicted protein [Monosiga brevicollis MX1]|eukprot:XP_001750748.1 hypothetical protein [Monosiga brevicollis MX1]